MANIMMRRFKSYFDLLSKFTAMFNGATFLMTFLRTDAQLREKILLAVSVANNCYG
ncbi:MAG: hypothetical protein JW807_09555 [Spirochaetes bacterium]|nr:hypothetical protein [Spirochaetota bacterium]